MFTLINKSGAGYIVRREVIFSDEPYIKSAAARALLLDYYRKLDEKETLERWLERRNVYLKRQLKEKGELICEYCGKRHLEIGSNSYKENNRNPLLATIDHKIPRSRNGKDIFENFAVSCRKCNTIKGSLTYNEYKK
jgi:hypothetical protein